MSTDSYYNKTWNEPDNHGTTFFKYVDFSDYRYKYQEQMFREYIRGLKDIHTVLEVGAGTGRMTKIMLEELPDILKYDTVDVKHNKELQQVYNNSFKGVSDNSYDFDITTKQFDRWFDVQYYKYDLIFASEVFMHIKPEDIEKVIEKLSKIGKQIINIDWAFNTYASDWCFIHPYHELYTKYGAVPEGIRPMKNISQTLFHYRFDND